LRERIASVYKRIVSLRDDIERSISVIKERERIIKQLLNEVDLFIAPSKFIKDKYRRFGLRKEKIVKLGYGIDLNPFKHIPQPKLSENRLDIGFIGSLIPTKGLHILFDAMIGLKSKRKVDLHIFGPSVNFRGNTLYARGMKRLSKIKGFKYHGEFEPDSIDGVFGTFHILVVPSIWQENSPMVIHESFAAGRPVIASDIGGIPELIVEEKGGILFKPGDSSELCNKIRQLLHDPSLLRGLKDNIPSVESITQNVKKLEDIYFSMK
jgi:glycosyltransferase involved in cell wall biosynthesis